MHCERRGRERGKKKEESNAEGEKLNGCIGGETLKGKRRAKKERKMRKEDQRKEGEEKQERKIKEGTQLRKNHGRGKINRKKTKK